VIDKIGARGSLEGAELDSRGFIVHSSKY
jgi:hypothetical protein